MLKLEEIQKMLEGKGGQIGGKHIGVNVAREANTKAIQRATWQSEEMMSLRESTKKKFGFDPADVQRFPVLESGFSWNKVAQKFGHRDAKSALREADSGSSFSQVLRAGVQTIVNNMYQTVETTFESWAHTVQSTKDTELYAPLHGLTFPREIGKQEKYPEVRAAGLDLKLKNRKFGTHYSVEKELLDDDQTGQFQRQVGYLGEYAKLVIEVYCYGKLASVAGAAYADLQVPTSETQPSTESAYPYSTGLVGGGANRPSSYGAFTQANIQNGFIGLMNQKNLLGLKILVNPNRLIISPKYRFDAAVLLHSAAYPSVLSSTPGAAGQVFGINPIEGIANLTVSRFVFKNDGTVNGDSNAWYLMDDSKPWFVAQIREAASVLQENPASGESFDRDVVRFKLTLRANADHIDPRFVWQGNDGSV